MILTWCLFRLFLVFTLMLEGRVEWQVPLPVFASLTDNDSTAVKLINYKDSTWGPLIKYCKCMIWEDTNKHKYTVDDQLLPPPTRMCCWACIKGDIENMLIFLNTWQHFNINNFGTCHSDGLRCFISFSLFYYPVYMYMSLCVYMISQL